jgi:hypothetical protein
MTFIPLLGYQKLEEQLIANEHDFRMKQLSMEEMRKLEWEHKPNMVKKDRLDQQ